MYNISISKAAKILKVNKVTLIRWDKSGKLSAKRELVSKNRYYSLDLVKALAEYKDHLRELKPIKEKANKYSATRPLDPFTSIEPHNLKDLKKAFDDLRKWERKHKRLRKKYLETKENANLKT
jgi:DNA-binding transcriptional MerR regulator